MTYTINRSNLIFQPKAKMLVIPRKKEVIRNQLRNLNIKEQNNLESIKEDISDGGFDTTKEQKEILDLNNTAQKNTQQVNSNNQQCIRIRNNSPIDIDEYNSNNIQDGLYLDDFIPVYNQENKLINHQIRPITRKNNAKDKINLMNRTDLPVINLDDSIPVSNQENKLINHQTRSTTRKNYSDKNKINLMNRSVQTDIDEFNAESFQNGLHLDNFIPVSNQENYHQTRPTNSPNKNERNLMKCTHYRTNTQDIQLHLDDFIPVSNQENKQTRPTNSPNKNKRNLLYRTNTKDLPQLSKTSDSFLHQNNESTQCIEVDDEEKACRWTRWQLPKPNRQLRIDQVKQFSNGKIMVNGLIKDDHDKNNGTTNSVDKHLRRKTRIYGQQKHTRNSSPQSRCDNNKLNKKIDSTIDKELQSSQHFH